MGSYQNSRRRGRTPDRPDRLTGISVRDMRNQIMSDIMGGGSGEGGGGGLSTRDMVNLALQEQQSQLEERRYQLSERTRILNERRLEMELSSQEMALAREEEAIATIGQVDSYLNTVDPNHPEALGFLRVAK